MLLADGARHTRHWSGVIRLTRVGGLQQKSDLAIMPLSRDFRCALVPRDGGNLMAGPVRFQSLPGTESSSGFVVASAARGT
jgi:hypothetical protein